VRTPRRALFPDPPEAPPANPVRWRVAVAARPWESTAVVARLAFDAWRLAAPVLGHPTFAEVRCWVEEA
jgi:hypothetical protein